ncbi:MAG: methyltransferase domain-containing protein, partial [Fidelibacterota bacterium]
DLSHLDHIVYDLNRSLDPSTWPDVDVPFTLIVCAETIEHLSTAPEFTFAMLSTLLQPGGFILVTTPNAVSVHKRLLMLMGRNPFERLRYYPLNPGDFRQYTQNEVKEMALRIGLDVEECGTVNFLTSRFRSIRLLKRIPGLRDSILAVLSRGQ